MISHLSREPEREFMDIPEEAEAYAGADFSDVNQRFVERLLELAGTLDSVVSLDLGTGPGDIPARIIQQQPGWRVVAVDASRAMLGFARRSSFQTARPDSIALVLADAKVLPFSANAFDVVFSNSILHHICEVQLFWHELKRVARPGALIFLRDLARPQSRLLASRIVTTYAGRESHLLQEEYRRSLAAAYTPDEVRRQLESAGLYSLEVAMVSDRHWDVFGRLQ